MKITDLETGLLQESLEKNQEVIKGIDFAFKILDTNSNRFFADAMVGVLNRMNSFIHDSEFIVKKVLKHIEDREEQQKHIDEVLGEETDDDDYNTLIIHEINYLDSMRINVKSMIDSHDRNELEGLLTLRINELNKILKARRKND